MNVPFVLGKMGSLEYRLTYQPYSDSDPWSLFYINRYGCSIETHGPTPESCINAALREDI